MLFRLDFRQTDEGKFLVDVHKAGPANHEIGGPRSIAVLFSSGQTFLELARCAELDADDVAGLEEAINAATSQPETPVCCKQVELDTHQLGRLNLDRAAELT